MTTLDALKRFTFLTVEIEALSRRLDKATGDSAAAIWAKVTPLVAERKMIAEDYKIGPAN